MVQSSIILSIKEGFLSMKKKIATLLLTSILVLTSTMFAYADDVETVTANAGEEKKVEGNVTGSAESATAVSAAGEGATVVVTGNVESTKNEYGMGVEAFEGASVTVGGDVTSNSNAIETGGKVNVTVDGDVTSKNGEAVAAGDGATVVVGKNATGGGAVTLQVAAGEKEDEITTVVVGQNVSGKTAVNITGYDDGKGAAIVVIEGKVSGSEDAVALSTFGSDFPKATIIAYEVDGSVSKVKNTWDDSIGEWGDFVTTKTDASDTINYIIKKDSDNITGYDSGTTAYTVNGKTYDTAKAGASVVIRVKEGYAVKAGQIEVTKNADGTYTIVVPKGGGVTLTTEQIQQAVKEIEKQENSSPEIEKQEKSSESSSSSNENNLQTQSAPVSTVSATVDPVSMGDAAYVSKVTSMIASAPYGGTVELNVTSTAYLTELIVSALETRSDVSVKINVTIDGVPYVLNIPAGFNLRALMGADGKIDIQKLLAAFGTKNN
jgi:hypothetical protein